MRNFLSNALLLHWTVVFAALALLCALEPEAGLRAPLDLLGLDAAAADPAFALRSSALFGSAFLLASVLFLWAFLSAATGEAGSADTTRLAFTVAVLVLTVLFAACAFRSVGGLSATVALMLAATLASYLVIAVEERRDAENADARPVAKTAKMMALDAALTSSMRGQPDPGRGVQTEGTK